MPAALTTNYSNFTNGCTMGSWLWGSYYDGTRISVVFGYDFFRARVCGIVYSFKYE